jgi:hypothetical protein
MISFRGERAQLISQTLIPEAGEKIGKSAQNLLIHALRFSRPHPPNQLLFSDAFKGSSHPCRLLKREDGQP